MQLSKPANQRETSFFEVVSAAYYEEFVEEFDDEKEAHDSILDDDVDANAAQAPGTRSFRAFSWHRLSCVMSRALSSLII